MSISKKSVAAIVVIALIGISGCQTRSRDQLLKTNVSSVETRSMQTRAFDTKDKNKTLRTIIATLQDLSFVVDKADEVLGSVSATKLDGYQLRMTVTVRPRGESQLLVRANAQYNLTAVDDPEVYQDFFTALAKSMFLTANEVD
ncbi:MAG: hypothetical protein O7D86_03065 [Proteobacteria bacterium]|nr:hypothetical protein [Pseudomonadota bacterium]